MYHSQEELSHAVANVTQRFTAMEEDLPVELAKMDLSIMDEPVPVPAVITKTTNPFIIPKKPKKTDICKNMSKQIPPEFRSLYPSTKRSVPRQQGTNIYDLSNGELRAVVKSISNTNLEGLTSRELREYVVKNNDFYYFGSITSRVILQDWKEEYYLNSPEYREYHRQTHPWLYK
jgi:hypothetical protein